MRNTLNIVVIYISTITLLFSQTMPAYAGLVGTEQFMGQQLVELDRETLCNVFQRDEARTLLKKHGITHEQAQERVNAMTDQEVRIFAQKFEEQPAAGSVGIVAAVLIIVLLFIALDLSGKTDVFKGI
ncbi:MAG: PA2779 family protein [Gammaproteobacteria bacterium]|nr:PA2779 family protein [Gammaproteobacteria bacterium]